MYFSLGINSFPINFNFFLRLKKISIPLCFREQIRQMRILHTTAIAPLSVQSFYWSHSWIFFQGAERFAETLHARTFDYVLPPDHQLVFGSRKASRVQRHGSKRETGIMNGIRLDSPPIGRLDCVVAKTGAQLLGSRHRWTRVIMHRKPRELALIDLIFIRKIMTINANMCAAMR